MEGADTNGEAGHDGRKCIKFYSWSYLRYVRGILPIEGGLMENRVVISGIVMKNPTYCFKFLNGNRFYKTVVSCVRKSGIEDLIPVIIREQDTERVIEGKYIRIFGRFYSRNVGKKLILEVWTKKVESLQTRLDDDINKILLEGYICKEPVYRKTPLNRKILDLMLAVNRPSKKSDYIPCIAWEANAWILNGMHVGDKIFIKGRIQSRDYLKKISEEEYETRTAYEVSIFDYELQDTGGK